MGYSRERDDDGSLYNHVCYSVHWATLEVAVKVRVGTATRDFAHRKKQFSDMAKGGDRFEVFIAELSPIPAV
jgi:hypothetical protein